MSAALDTDRSVVALRRTVCCGCGGPMPKQGPISVILLNKRVEWRYPSHGNVLVPGSGGRAVSVLCNYCLRNDVTPKTAVEIREDGAVVHHPVDELVDLPEITEEDLRDVRG